MRLPISLPTLPQRLLLMRTSLSSGFTLIELLVVISIIGIISSVTLASLGNFNKANSLKQTASQLASFLSDAKSRSLSQLKPTGCNGDLSGYTVDFCLNTGGSCTSVDSYVLSVTCGGTKTKLVTRRLPSAVHFTSSGTTSSSYTFGILNGGVTGSGRTIISGYGTTASVVVSQTGAVSIQ